MKRIATSTVVLSVLFGAPAIGAPKHTRAANQSQPGMTFSGGCAFAGTVQFRPPLTNTGQPASDFASARGTCSGELTDRRGETHQINAAPVAYLASDEGSDVSCGLSAGTTGSGELVFPWGTLGFVLSETRAGGIAELSLAGNGGGSATGVASVSTEANPAQVIAACAGAGLREVPVQINVHTTPTISG